MAFWSGLDGGRLRLEEFLENHRGSLLFLLTLFFIGVIFGSLAVRSLETNDRLTLVQHLGIHLPALAAPPDGADRLMLTRALSGSAKLMALLWVMGITVVGALGVMLYVLIRGFVTGFVVSFLAAELGLQGVLLGLAGHLPHSMLEVPAVLLASAAALGFSGLIIRSWQERRRLTNFYVNLGSYTVTLILISMVLGVAAFVESYISPPLVAVVARLMQSPLP